MDDKRLIDANALPMHKVKIVHAFGLVEGCVVFPDSIAKAPTIDAVEVVRCRECKKRQDPRECPMCFTEVEDIEGGRMYKFTDLTKDDGFCHMGAKMDGGATDVCTV